MLTKQDIEILRAPFPPNEIEFLRGYAYVREQAINNRLSEIDPSWHLQITAWEYRAENHVVVMGSMTLNECTRCGVGEQLNEPAKDKQTQQLLPPKTIDCAKGAATDLLKRCARLFHVGLYLTELPDDVRDYASYKAWYAKETGAAQTAQDRAIAGLKQVGLTLDQAIAIAKQQPPNNVHSDVEWGAWLQIVNQKRKAG